MKKTQLNFLVISDLHAHGGDPRKGDAPSFYSTNNLYATSDVNPLAGIPDVVRNSGLEVDWIVCPGDLGDKADPVSQTLAWSHLERIKNALEAELLIGTAGNHDVDSRRFHSDFDPKSALQQLTPTFPTDIGCYMAADCVYSDRFWSRNFVIIPLSDFDCTLLILNSCAFHGFASDARRRTPPEHVRGKVSQLTLSAIKSAIARVGTRLNILLVHHHPKKIPYVDDDNSIMLGGDVLIEILKDTHKQWLVIHGHAHAPALMYADANQFAPIILSAGTVAAKTVRMKAGYARNQVHHVSIDLDKVEPAGTQIFGRVTSWTWAFENGWERSAGSSVLPHKTGFGYRFDAIEIRDAIVSEAKAAAPRLLLWTDVLQRLPKLLYLTPEDHSSLVHLVQTAGVKTEVDPYGVPIKLEWPA